jgi:hypothetical protein
MIATDELISTTPDKAHKKPRRMVVVVIGVLVLFSAICAAAIALSVGKVAVEKAPIEAVLDSFMKSMAAKDVQSAYGFFSPSAQKQFPFSQLQELTEGANFAVFEGYQSLSVQNTKIITTGNVYHPDLPKEIDAPVTGVTFYDDGFQGTLDGTLEKVDGKWLIYRFNVVVPPDKIRP